MNVCDIVMVKVNVNGMSVIDLYLFLNIKTPLRHLINYFVWNLFEILEYVIPPRIFIKK